MDRLHGCNDLDFSINNFDQFTDETMPSIIKQICPFQIFKGENAMWPEIIVDEWIKSVLKGIGACLAVMVAVIVLMMAIGNLP